MILSNNVLDNSDILVSTGITGICFINDCSFSIYIKLTKKLGNYDIEYTSRV